MLIILALIALVTACGRQDAEPRVDAPTEIVAKFDEASGRLLAMTEPHGWVVSRWLDEGAVEHTGDSLLWTGVALGVLACGGGEAPEDALVAMLTDGNLYRHPSEAAREASLDGQLGLWWGIIKRVERCPESREKWAAALENYEPVNVPEAFNVVLEEARYRVGIGAAPSAVRVSGLAHIVAGWASVVVASKKAGFRLHLGWLSLSALGADNGSYCAATRGAGIPLVEHFCGREPLFDWIDQFQYDVWEYRHQRAKWEDPDGKPGLATPGLDLLVAIRESYNI